MFIRGRQLWNTTASDWSST